MNPFTVYESWLDEKNNDVMAFLDVLAANGCSTDPTGFDENGKAIWTITDYQDDNNTYPDFLERLFGIGLVTNPSQGGMGG